MTIPARHLARGTCIRGGLLALAVSFLCAATASPALAKVPASYLAEDKTLAYDYAGIEGAKLGVALPGGAVKFLDIEQSSAPRVFGGSALAYTSCGYANEEVASCELQIGTLAHTQHELLKATVAHEVFHAFQAVMCGKVHECYAEKFHWLVEGSAEWAGVQVTGGDSTSRKVLARYFDTPGTPLFSREYEAIGFFNHMQSVGISPWTRFKAMFKADSDEAAYDDAVAGNEEFLQTEASVFFREASGWPWAERPEAKPDPGLVHFRPSTIAVGGSGHAPVVVQPYADGVYHLSLTGMSANKPVLELIVNSGKVRIRSSNGDDVDQLVTGDIKLCSSASGCSCPSHPDNYPLFKDGDLAVTGATTGAKVELVARKRCEALLPARSCEQLLPGYSEEVAEALESVGKHFEPSGKFSKIEASNPSIGFSSSTCLFLFRGTVAKRALPVEINAEGEPEPTQYEEYFDGAIASGVNVSRYESAAAAKRGIEASLLASDYLGPQSVSGIGEEAWLSTKEEINARGEREYLSAAFVRSRNVTAYFLIAGNSDADAAEARLLLQQVAAGL
jgi:hypothetical protein